MKQIDQLNPALEKLRYKYTQFIHLPEVSAIIYFSEVNFEDPNTPLMAIGYRDKKRNWSFAKRFSSKDEMLEYIARWENFLMSKSMN